MRAAAYARAVCYARVSTVGQSGDNHWSLPVQQQRYRDVCEQNRWEPVGEFTDVDSGRRDNRREYQKLLTAARAGEVDVIVVQFLDRFGRNPREILRCYWELEELGVQICVTDEDVKEEIVLLIRAALAGKESERISQRVIPTMEAVVLAGRWPGDVPFGYDLIQNRASPDRGKLVVNEREAEIIRRIFDLYGNGYTGAESIARILNREGIPGPRKGRTQPAAFWWGTSVRYILGNHAYTGLTSWHGREVRCPRIIEESLWHLVQDVIERRKITQVRLGPQKDYLLQGLVRCACGTYRHCWTSHRSERVYPNGYHWPMHRYYRCNHTAHAERCRIGHLDATKLEQWVLDRFRQWTIPAELRSAPSPPRSNATLRQRQALEAKIERYRQRLSNSYDRRMDGEITKDEYAAKRAEYLAIITQAETELANLREQPAVDLNAAIGQIERFATDIAALSTEDLRAELAELIECVQVIDRHTFRLVPRPEFRALLGSLLG